MSWYEYAGAVQGGGFGPDDEERRRRRRHARDSVAYTGGMVSRASPRPSSGWGSRAPMPGEVMPTAEATAVQALPSSEPSAGWRSVGPLHAPRQAAAIDMGQGVQQPQIPEEKSDVPPRGWEPDIK